MRKEKSINEGYSDNNKIKLVPGGRTYFDQLIRVISMAEYSIQFQVYIFEDDETGHEVKTALLKAAGRKVQIFLMADGYASQNLSKAFIQDLKEAGIHFRYFEPLFKNRHAYFGRRLHHKIIVVDERYAMLGGINISNHYNDMPGQPAWMDFAVSIEGNMSKQLSAVCQKIWYGLTQAKKVILKKADNLTYDIPSSENALLRLRRNDWVNKKNQIFKSYIEMFGKAKDEIIIMSGYFLPGHIMRKNMAKAVKRGVKVKLILAGISDVMLAKHAERYMYNWVFKNNIELYEYKLSILHGKVSVYDCKWVTIGSFNVNDISAFASIELNMDVSNTDFATLTRNTLQQIIEKDCTQMSKEKYNVETNIFSRFFDHCCYLLIRFLFFLFTFNFKQKI